MTDVPRRSYPLVVPPPGGFEDAVRRGRRVRRRRAGGSTGAALMLAGAITYASIGTPSNTDGLRPAKQTPRQEQTQAPYGESTPTPEPTASPAPTASPDAAGGTAAPGGGPAGPTAAPGTAAPPPAEIDPTASARPPREQQPRTYAKRGPIHESDPMPIGGDTQCFVEAQKWCAMASERGNTISVPRTYELSYMLCRGPNAGPGVVRFDRAQKVEFAVRHVQTNDTVWTYSAGQPVGLPADSTEVPAGYCVEWYTTWDGYDDFGHTPLPGTYELIAVSTGSSDATLPTKRDTFEVAGQ